MSPRFRKTNSAAAMQHPINLMKRGGHQRPCFRPPREPAVLQEKQLLQGPVERVHERRFVSEQRSKRGLAPSEGEGLNLLGGEPLLHPWPARRHPSVPASRSPHMAAGTA
jgi:hypothetical protein